VIPKKLYEIHQRILAPLKQHPEGISEGEMRSRLGIAVDKQVQFGRRRRELSAYFDIKKKRVGTETLYVYVGERDIQLDAQPINPRLRAQALHNAAGRCGMCGRTISKDQVTLVVDHRIPRDWGGLTVSENLWAICEDCNHGKKNLFASMDTPAVRKAMNHKSVHVRIGELLKAVGVGNPVSSLLIEFVAQDQEDWHKRLRELRYLGWVIEVSKRRTPEGRVRSAYTLVKWTAWPDDPARWIRNFEKQRELKNRS
jgi:5-methylcytosine-specific restriction endonuclease McrA